MHALYYIYHATSSSYQRLKPGLVNGKKLCNWLLGQLNSKTWRLISDTPRGCWCNTQTYLKCLLSFRSILCYPLNCIISESSTYQAKLTHACQGISWNSILPRSLAEATPIGPGFILYHFILISLHPVLRVRRDKSTKIKCKPMKTRIRIIVIQLFKHYQEIILTVDFIAVRN